MRFVYTFIEDSHDVRAVKFVLGSLRQDVNVTVDVEMFYVSR